MRFEPLITAWRFVRVAITSTAGRFRCGSGSRRVRSVLATETVDGATRHGQLLLRGFSATRQDT